MTIIGVEWSGSNSSPTLTRIGYDGTHATYSGPASGGTPFNAFGTWGNMQRVTVADDGSVTSTWGSFCYSDSDTALGQVMVQIPAFLFWTDTLNYNSYGGHARYYIADLSDIGQQITPYGILVAPHVLSTSDIHPLFYVDGSFVENAYVGAFEGFLDPNTSLLTSVAGRLPSTIDTNTDARSYAENRGTGWELTTIQALSALQLLSMVENATLNSQSAIGNGIVGASQPANTGATGSTGTDQGNLSYGTGANNTTAMSYRGVENLYGNLEMVVEGINISNYPTAYIAPQSRTRPVYYQWNELGSPYVAGPNLVNSGSGGWIKAMAPGTGLFYLLPITSGGSSSTYFCDQTWMPSLSNMVLYQGGNYADGAGAGIFAQRYEQVDTYPAGARLQYLPSA